MEKLEEYVQKSQFSDILRVNFDQKCLRGQKCLLMRSTENVIKYNRGRDPQNPKNSQCMEPKIGTDPKST